MKRWILLLLLFANANLTRAVLEPPSVRFEELYSSIYGAPAQIELLAGVRGMIAVRVQFIEGDTVLGESGAPRPGDGSFAFTWSNIPRGVYTLRARAFDAAGASVTSYSRTILVSGPAQGAGLAIVHVDQNNQTGIENGSAARPFSTIQEGVDNAAAGGVVKVAQGIYRESILIDNVSLQVLGGFVGGSVSAYAQGGAGDFQLNNPVGRAVRVEPPARRTAFGLYNARDSVVEGFEISNAARGFFASADSPAESFPKLRRNSVRDCGEPFREFGGGGVHAENSSLELIGNNIINNVGGRGGGVSAGGILASVVIRDNVIRGNVAYDDHGGGLYILANGVITGNEIRNNEVGRGVDYGGWGGGLIVFGDSSSFFPQITLSNNIVTGNIAGDGSGEFFDEGARAVVEHELIYGNTTGQNTGSAVLVDGCCNSSLSMSHSTVADNGLPGVGLGISVNVESSAEVIDSIFWNNGVAEFAAQGGGTLRVSYTLSPSGVTSGNAITAGPGNITGDPLFVDSAQQDYRLKSTRGRWSSTARAWVVDAVSSPAIDAADPAADFSFETMPNGGRADLGVYGNRAEVGLTASLVGQEVRLRGYGANGRAYRLERSEDFSTWSEITTLTSATGQVEYVDQLSAQPRYYRVRQ